MQAGTDGESKDAGTGFTGGGDGIDDDAVVSDLDEAAGGLAEEVEFGGAAFCLESD